MDTLTKSQRMRAYAKKAKRMAAAHERPCQHPHPIFQRRRMAHHDDIELRFICHDCDLRSVVGLYSTSVRSHSEFVAELSRNIQCLRPGTDIRKIQWSE